MFHRRCVGDRNVPKCIFSARGVYRNLVHLESGIDWTLIGVLDLLLIHSGWVASVVALMHFASSISSQLLDSFGCLGLLFFG